MYQSVGEAAHAAAYGGHILFRRGWNAVQVQKYLGHHSPAFTLATYVHMLPDDLPEPVCMDGILSAAASLDEDGPDTPYATEEAQG